MRSSQWRAGAVALGFVVFTLACEQAGLPDNPNAQMPSKEKIKPAIDTRTRAAAQLEALPNSMSRTITGVVSLAEGVTPGEGTLFVIARVAGVQGGPPLAVGRFSSDEFPTRFELSKANTMMPGAKFEGELQLSARLDRDGNPMTTDPGDLSGMAAMPSQVGAAGVQIVLGGASPAPAAAPAMAPAAAPAAAPGMGMAKAVPASGGSVAGRIELPEGVQTPAGGVVFVMARTAGVKAGPPLAVLRLTPGAWPLEFTLGVQNLMMPGASLDGPLDISVRLDSDGNAMTKGAGDLVGETASPVTLGQSDVSIPLSPYQG